MQKKNKLARYSSKKYSYLRNVASKSSSYILIALAQTRNSDLGYFYKGSKKVARFLYVKCLRNQKIITEEIIMNKKELIASVAEAAGISKKDAAAAVDATFASISKEYATLKVIAR